MGRPKPVEFKPKHPEKYKGTYPITMRSSWEVLFAKKCDLMDDVVEWASEPVKIPYTDPTRLTKNNAPKQSIYIPDFLITVKDSKGRLHTSLVEIKPKHESGLKEAKNLAENVSITRNQAKWAAAAWWCQRRGITFKVLTEDNLFNTGSAPAHINVMTQKKLKTPTSIKPKKKVLKKKVSKKPTAISVKASNRAAKATKVLKVNKITKT